MATETAPAEPEVLRRKRRLTIQSPETGRERCKGQYRVRVHWPENRAERALVELVDDKGGVAYSMPEAHVRIVSPKVAEATDPDGTKWRLTCSCMG